MTYNVFGGTLNPAQLLDLDWHLSWYNFQVLNIGSLGIITSLAYADLYFASMSERIDTSMA